jgi:hypothetical protein
MGSLSRRKGIRWELEIAARLREIFGPSVARGFQFRAGAEVPDVDVPGMWIEAKVGRQTNPRAALRQAATAAAGTGRIPLAICKDDREPPHVTLLLDDFVELLREWHQLKTR